MSIVGESTRSANSKGVFLAVIAILVATVVVYLNSFCVPLLLDDDTTIANNPSIRDLRQITAVLSPPERVFSAGRPLLNLTFALNYAESGTEVRGYHAVNLLIHFLAALTLFGIVRRVLMLSAWQARFPEANVGIALAASLLWTVHPLETVSVTYISQRAESLMALCYLATLYFFLRGVTSRASSVCYVLAVGTCLLGMATKEVMVTAPVLVLLFDRAYIGRSWREIRDKRWKLYAGLVSTWLLLAGLMARSHLQQRVVGQAGALSWSYALLEGEVILRYLKLTFWPNPLIFDYGFDFSTLATSAVVAALAVAALVLIALILWRWRPGVGFLALWPFLVLAPTSSLVPVAGQPMAESRMYLPLAAVAVLSAVGAFVVAGRKGWAVVTAAGLAFGALAVHRNSEFRTSAAIWNDTVAKLPTSSRAHAQFAAAIQNDPNRGDEAIVHYEQALQLRSDLVGGFELRPKYEASIRQQLGILLTEKNRASEAIPHLERALQLNPNAADVHCNLAVALRATGRAAEAIEHLEAAVRLEPSLAEAHFNLGNALATIPGRIDDAVTHYEATLRLRPGYADAHYNLAVLLANHSRVPDAVPHFEAALRINPDYDSARKALIQLHALPEGSAQH